MDPAAFVKRYYEIFDADRRQLTPLYVRRLLPNFPEFQSRPLGRGDRH
jgi:hypothetical protein